MKEEPAWLHLHPSHPWRGRPSTPSALSPPFPGLVKLENARETVSNFLVIFLFVSTLRAFYTNKSLIVHLKFRYDWAPVFLFARCGHARRARVPPGPLALLAMLPSPSLRPLPS